ncbi:MAG: hypothetical protein KKA64_01500 [Nanoarchaeota archaeon]|nr:hypothetical protein [Nanoarchaeota archaeon]
MIRGRRGQTSRKAVLIILGTIIGLALLIWGITALTKSFGSSTSVTARAGVFQQAGDVLGNANLNFLSYFIGGIPTFLIEQVGAISSFIIILGIFIMLFVTFGDIFNNFGAFSNSVAWVIAGVLAIIAANLKLVMYIAVWAFGLASGIGVLSVAVGIIVPFIIFLVLNVFLGAQLRHLKDAATMEKGANEVSGAIKSFKKAAKAFKS